MSPRASLQGYDFYNTAMPEQPVENPIRIAVVGLGSRGRLNAIPKLNYFDDYELVSVCDIRPDLVDLTMSTLKEEGVQVKGYTDFQEMLKGEKLDAVALQLDADKQIGIACQAMRAGLHVMAEVPLTYSIDDCWDVVTTVEQTGKLFFLMEQVRYAGYVDAYRNIVQSGAIGKPVFAEGEYFHYIPGRFFQDDSGRWYPPESFGKDPRAKATWRYTNPVLGYLPHDLSPMLYILDDRVTRVVGMGNRKQSHKYPNMQYHDTQAAMMHTEKDVVLRMAAGFITPSVDRIGGHWGHWQQIKATDGVIEGPRCVGQQHKLYIPKWQMENPIDMPWSLPRIDAPPQAAGSGHGDCDYYVFAAFADALIYDVMPDFDVYQAVETAAPAILATESIENDNVPIDVPDFRPGPHRKPGQRP